MQKKLFFILTLFTVFEAKSQFFEDFEQGTMPDGWAVSYNGTNSFLPWEVTSQQGRILEGTASVWANRQNVGINVYTEQWLITPAISVTAASILSFVNGRTFPGSDQGTTYAVRISTTSQTDYSNFSDLAAWNELQLDEAYIRHLPLAAYAGETVYVAFIRFFTQPGNSTNGDRWIIDNVSVTNTLANDKFDVSDKFSVFPNPANDILHLKMNNSEAKSVAVYNLTGQLLLHYNDAEDIDISGLASGNYLIEVTSEKGKATKKFIKF